MKIGNEYSQIGRPKGGVPQGTIFGPNVFLLNDIWSVI